MDTEEIAERWPIFLIGCICIKRDGTIIFTANHIHDHCVYTFRPGIDEDPTSSIILAGRQRESGSDDGPGATAKFRRPQGIALCADGSLVVADSGNHRIRKISPLGFVTTLAGSGQEGFADGPGADAVFSSPSGVAVRPDGTIVVADRFNNRIRLISPAGLVTTLAGSGAAGFADGSAAEARFMRPWGVAVGPDGDVLVCDVGNHRIRRIVADGAVSTVAGSGAAGHLDGTGGAATFDFPRSIAVDTNGHAVVGEAGGCIRKIVLATGEVTTVANGFGHGIVTALAIDPAGSVVFQNPATKTLSQIAKAGLGPGFSVNNIPIWTPTRKSHRGTPEWSRDAVNTMALITTRARYSKPGRLNAVEWLNQLPLLPQMLWEMIIGLIPIHHIGRPDGAPIAYDPDWAKWFIKQIKIVQKRAQEEDAQKSLGAPHPTTSVPPMRPHRSDSNK